MFTGLSAFPLTPFKDEKIDFDAFEKLMAPLVAAKVNSICAMGSTGLYPYLSSDERAAVAKKTVELSGEIPVMVGIGALRTKDVLINLERAQAAGADAVLLAPVSYHSLLEDEVFSLYQSVSKELSVPLCVYDNPGVTRFEFSDQLYQSITALPHVKAIKIPGVPFTKNNGETHIAHLRQFIPKEVAIGVSGDKFGANGMAAGCDLWLSVIGGVLPETVQAMIQLATTGQLAEAEQLSNKLSLLWQLAAKYRGGMRIAAAVAAIKGRVSNNCLPNPLKTVSEGDYQQLNSLMTQFELN